MVIEKIEVRKNIAEITTSEGGYCLSYEVAVQRGLCVGKTLTWAELKELQALSAELLCRDYLYSLIARWSKTRKGYYTKLKEKGYPHHVINSALDSAQSKGYIDDRQFAERYIASRSNSRGNLRIKNELLAKGVAKDIIDELLSEHETDCQVIANIAERFMKNREKTRENLNKLYRHLAQKGFNGEEILQVLRVYRTE